MRRAFVLAATLFAGCYSPTITPGAPCDPAIGNCPRPLTCLPGATGATCELPGTTPPDAPGTVDVAPPDAAPDALPDAPAITHVEYPASVAECTDPSAPDPDFCINRNGTGRLAVDNSDTASGNGWVSFLRFDLDGVIAGRTVTSVKLQLNVSMDGAAASNNSGVVWLVGAFTRASLDSSVPPVIGGSAIAGTQGAVAPGDVVSWSLPPALAMANGSVFLKVSSPSDDGALYYSNTGTRPPKLVLDLQ